MKKQEGKPKSTSISVPAAKITGNKKPTSSKSKGAK